MKNIQPENTYSSRDADLVPNRLDYNIEKKMDPDLGSTNLRNYFKPCGAEGDISYN